MRRKRRRRSRKIREKDGKLFVPILILLISRHLDSDWNFEIHPKVPWPFWEALVRIEIPSDDANETSNRRKLEVGSLNGRGPSDIQTQIPFHVGFRRRTTKWSSPKEVRALKVWQLTMRSRRVKKKGATVDGHPHLSSPFVCLGTVLSSARLKPIWAGPKRLSRDSNQQARAGPDYRASFHGVRINRHSCEDYAKASFQLPDRELLSSSKVFAELKFIVNYLSFPTFSSFKTITNFAFSLINTRWVVYPPCISIFWITWRIFKIAISDN